jgi:hypothetical protein
MLVVADVISKQLEAAWQGYCLNVSRFDDNNVGRGDWRPEGWVSPWICVWIAGESAAPIARPDPPLRLRRQNNWPQFACSFLHGHADNRRYGAEIPAQNPHSRDLHSKRRSHLTAMMFQYSWNLRNSSAQRPSEKCPKIRVLRQVTKFAGSHADKRISIAKNRAFKMCRTGAYDIFNKWA